MRFVAAAASWLIVSGLTILILVTLATIVSLSQAWLLSPAAALVAAIVLFTVRRPAVAVACAVLGLVSAALAIYGVLTSSPSIVPSFLLMLGASAAAAILSAVAALPARSR